MRSTIDINDNLLREAMSLTKAQTKKELFNISLKELIRQRRKERLKAKLGNFSLSLKLKDLERMRRNG